MNRPAPLTPIGDLSKGFAALTLPKVTWVVLVSFVAAVGGGVLLFFLTRWLLTGFEIFTWAWANWLLDTFTGIALFFVVLLMFPVIVVTIAAMLLDYVVDAVEAKDYPHLPPTRPISNGFLVLYIIKFTGLLLLVNILVLPLYLLLPGLNFVISWCVNGWLIGREYFDLVAMRRLTGRQMATLRRRHGGRLFRRGFVTAILMTVPILNLLMPVVAAASFTHTFHGLPDPESDTQSN